MRDSSHAFKTFSFTKQKRHKGLKICLGSLHLNGKGNGLNCIDVNRIQHPEEEPQARVTAEETFS